MGVADFYSLHVMKICSGTITADEKWVIDGCSNYSTALNGLTKLTSYTPSTFRVVNTTMTIPILVLLRPQCPLLLES
ncbi:hypothetical protein DID88_008324 [Monilinia fructigena]|uniref:Uncharacterized protein n=1 Tax=Monilinia fructigena TaxID=38457 RepID=A0A395JA28_9HELO|nr:hypothetical protein DID88_008324 [Monilinia fructigena]